MWLVAILTIACHPSLIDRSRPFLGAEGFEDQEIRVRRRIKVGEL